MRRARLRSRFRSPLFARTAGGGAPTHTILRSLDFESSASASSATPAHGILKLRSPRRSSSASEHRDSVGVANAHFSLLGVGARSGGLKAALGVQVPSLCSDEIERLQTSRRSENFANNDCIA